MVLPRCSRIRIVAWLGLLLACSLAAGPALPDQKAAARPDQDEEPFLPGLTATFHDGQGNTATRIDYQLSHHWRAQPPDPRLAEGEFRAVWQGRLLTNPRGEYRFIVFGTGEIELKVAGRVVLARQTLQNESCQSQPVLLEADYHLFELFLRRTGKEARLAVYWSSPQFGLEPIPARFLVHPREATIAPDFERGRFLARALRCGHCHEGETLSAPAPALDRLAGNLSREWLVQRLIGGGAHETTRTSGKVPGDLGAPQRMPEFHLSPDQAEAIADWLLEPRKGDPPLRPAEPAPAVVKEPPPSQGKKKTPARPRPDARMGERLFLSLGCLACHTWRDLGASGWFGGGDLTAIAGKRPEGYFATWLTEPALLNRDHRMPVFPLSADERTALSRFLAEQKPTPANQERQRPEQHAEGKKLAEQLRCAACHRLPGADREQTARPKPIAALGERSDWQTSCLESPRGTDLKSVLPKRGRPSYHLAEEDARALKRYFSSRRPGPANRPVSPDGLLLLAEQNCLACHAREGTREAIPLLPPLLAGKLTAVAQRYPDLAPLVPALTPPSLNSIGDKLTDQALADAILRRGDAHRPYLQVRMPRFPLRDPDLKALTDTFVAADRVEFQGTRPLTPNTPQKQDHYALAGGRLLSGDGFGCTSCHQVGSVLPSQAPLNARGPDLSQLQRRLRRPWFDRFVQNPARIVPHLEMPAIQLPVAGVLDGKVDEQLAAVWYALNLPGFEPPAPNPVRTLRHLGNDPHAEAVVVTDVLHHRDQVLLKPFLVGLANRHNLLLDLEAPALAAWTVGDAARQRTKGKNWFWESAGGTVLDTGIREPDLTLRIGGRELTPETRGQFTTEADSWQTEGAGVILRYRLTLAAPEKASGGREPPVAKTVMLPVERQFHPLPTGFAQELTAGPLPPSSQVRLRVLSEEATRRALLSADARTIQLGDRFASRITLSEPAGATFAADGTVVLSPREGTDRIRIVLHYQSAIPVDRFPEPPASTAAMARPEAVEVGPGLTGERLPLPPDIMPTGLSWRPNGHLVFCTLKGQVFEALDSDRDGSEDRLRLLADGLPAPYGIHAGEGYADVCTKYALLRVRERGRSGRHLETIASGWGYTLDYHDWAVGLPRSERGEYFLAIPCQESRRTPAEARLHGTVLRLVPRTPTVDDPRRFTLTPISGGLRYPMGLALSRGGDLFATDNQGNYKPFNELNHIRPGAFFGFPNLSDRGQSLPARTPTAIEIPHPWTRSVNGICFLDTPPALRVQLGHDAFGPLEGHLIGCEYNTRRLIRLSLQRVGDTYQGAAYPFSVPPQDPARGFLGPVVSAVSPRGVLYVGSIHDSGWGGGNNIGEIVRVPIEPRKLPCGIAEVRAVRDGFTIDFFRPVDRTLAGQAESYVIQSYRRYATPAYGGADIERRTERVKEVVVGPDGRRVTLRLGELRQGFVYEFRLKNLTPGRGEFHPAEAHYTLNVVVK